MSYFKSQKKHFNVFKCASQTNKQNSSRLIAYVWCMVYGIGLLFSMEYYQETFISNASLSSSFFTIHQSVEQDNEHWTKKRIFCIHVIFFTRAFQISEPNILNWINNKIVASDDSINRRRKIDFGLLFAIFCFVNITQSWPIYDCRPSCHTKIRIQIQFKSICHLRDILHDIHVYL